MCIDNNNYVGPMISYIYVVVVHIYIIQHRSIFIPASICNLLFITLTAAVTENVFITPRSRTKLENRGRCGQVNVTTASALVSVYVYVPRPKKMVNGLHGYR